MQTDITSFTKLNSNIFRKTQVYLDNVLKKYELTSGLYPYLLILNEKKGISQNQISKDLGHDKAMSARTISKLMDLGYIYREEDEADSRAYKLYLTEKAETIIPKVIKEIYNLIDLITEDLSEDEKIITIVSLNKILNSLKKLKM